MLGCTMCVTGVCALEMDGVGQRERESEREREKEREGD